MEFGRTLREARERKGLTISQVAEITHIMTQTLAGLEQENFKKIPAAIYGRGFVKRYCQAVGIADPQPLIDAFMDIYEGRTSPAPAAEPAPAPKPAPMPPKPAAVPPKPAPAPKPEPKPFQLVSDPVAREPVPAAQRVYKQVTMRQPVEIPALFSINWRLVILCLGGLVVLASVCLALTFLYNATMTPIDETGDTVQEAEPAPAAKAEAAPAKETAPGPRQQVKIRSLYMD